MNEPQIPLRKDGTPDLKNWQEYVRQFNFKNLGELIEAKNIAVENAEHGELWHDKFLCRAVTAKENEIARNLANTLCTEGLSVEQAISMLERAKTIINKSKFVTRQ